MKKIFIIITLLALTLNIKTVNAEGALNCNNYLKYGSTGREVKILQEELNHTMKCNLNVDGIIGPKTNNCILKFQEKYNLKTDGIVGPITCKRLNQRYNVEMNKNYVVVIGKKGTEVYVRSLPNIKPETIVGTVKQGDVLRVYETLSVDGTIWYRTFINQYGTVYIHGDYAMKNAIVIDIDNQQLTYYSNKKQVMSVPVITGLKYVSDTPKGKYVLSPNNKRRNQLLSGQTKYGEYYQKNVTYWMPFITDRQIGLHDASWRVMDDYTKTKYIEDGSQGCVNMRPADARRLYESITAATYVIVK